MKNTTEEQITDVLNCYSGYMPRRNLQQLVKRKDFITSYHAMILHAKIEESGTGKPGDPVMVKLTGSTQIKPRSTPTEHSHRLIDLVGRSAILDLIARIDASSEADIADHIRLALQQYKPIKLKEMHDEKE